MADNSYAFPVSTIDGFTTVGMTLRDWFAGMALSNPAICKHDDEWPQKTAYCFADAMLAQREKNDG